MKKMQHRAGSIVNSPRLGFRRHLSSRSGKKPGPAMRRTVHWNFRLYRASRGFDRVLPAAASKRRLPFSRS
jgi:hypothetical protein